MTVGARLTTEEPQPGNDTTDENKRKALEALESRGSRHDAAAAADVSLKTLDDWRRRDDQFAGDWDATIDRVMKRLREQPLDDKGNFKRSPLQYGLKATDENKEIVLAMACQRRHVRRCRSRGRGSSPHHHQMARSRRGIRGALE